MAQKIFWEVDQTYTINKKYIGVEKLFSDVSGLASF